MQKKNQRIHRTYLLANHFRKFISYIIIMKKIVKFLYILMNNQKHKKKIMPLKDTIIIKIKYFKVNKSIKTYILTVYNYIEPESMNKQKTPILID